MTIGWHGVRRTTRHRQPEPDSACELAFYANVRVSVVACMPTTSNAIRLR